MLWTVQSFNYGCAKSLIKTSSCETI